MNLCLHFLKDLGKSFTEMTKNRLTNYTISLQVAFQLQAKTFKQVVLNFLKMIKTFSENSLNFEKY